VQMNVGNIQLANMIAFMFAVPSLDLGKSSVSLCMYNNSYCEHVVWTVLGMGVTIINPGIISVLLFQAQTQDRFKPLEVSVS